MTEGAAESSHPLAEILTTAGGSLLYTPARLLAATGQLGFEDEVHEYLHADRERTPADLLVESDHDRAVDRGLRDMIAAWERDGAGPVVGIMGGHAATRDSESYGRAAHLGRNLALAGCLVLTGGGPGVMEAVNLGAAYRRHDDRTFSSALATVSASGDGPLPAGTVPASAAAHTVGGIGISSWLNDVPQKSNAFAGAVARYAARAFPEDVLMDLCRCRTVFMPGGAGTVQEVFQTVTKIYYGMGGASGPLVLVDSAFWRDHLSLDRPLRTLLGQARTGDQSEVLHILDDVDEVLAVVTA